MRQRLTVSKTMVMTEKMVEDVQSLADEFGVSFADIVRECIESDLPRLKDRERKRKKARQKRR